MFSKYDIYLLKKKISERYEQVFASKKSLCK